MGTKNFSVDVILDLGVLGEQELCVEYEYSPSTPDVMYLPNGDPGYPGDPEEFEILKVSLDGENVTWIFDRCEALWDAAIEKARDEASQPDDHWEP